MQRFPIKKTLVPLGIDGATAAAALCVLSEAAALTEVNSARNGVAATAAELATMNFLRLKMASSFFIFSPCMNYKVELLYPV